MRERARTQKTYRVRRAEGFLEDRVERLARPKPVYLGVHCPGCGCDVLPLKDGSCAWCGRVVVLWDGTAIHEREAVA